MYTSYPRVSILPCSHGDIASGLPPNFMTFLSRSDRFEFGFPGPAERTHPCRFGTATSLNAIRVACCPRAQWHRCARGANITPQGS